MKRCKICERPMPNDANFCPHCGAAVSEDHSEEFVEDYEEPIAPENAVNDELSVGRIKLCPDGKYRWIYELNMYKNPTLIILVLKIFTYIILGIWVFMVVLNLFEGFDWDSFVGVTKLSLIVLCIIIVLSIISYLLLAAIYGGKYIVFFEMDEKGVLHQQMKSQVKKSNALALLTVLAGIASKNITTAGVGMNSASNNSMYSSFESVRSVKAYKNRNLIKVNELLFKNQVYVEKEDFDFVYDYITKRCPRLHVKE